MSLRHGRLGHGESNDSALRPNRNPRGARVRGSNASLGDTPTLEGNVPPRTAAQGAWDGPAKVDGDDIGVGVEVVPHVRRLHVKGVNHRLGASLEPGRRVVIVPRRGAENGDGSDDDRRRTDDRDRETCAAHCACPSASRELLTGRAPLRRPAPRCRGPSEHGALAPRAEAGARGRARCPRRRAR